MNNKIYLVMYSYYSDWTIYGYFTNREDADKYCIAHENEELYVREIDCYDNIEEDFRNITLKYTFPILFRNINNNYELETTEENYVYDCYQDEFLHSNKVESCLPKNWVRINVNIAERNFDKAKKIALDLWYQYLDFCNKKPSENSIYKFNKILSKEEDERKERIKQEAVKEKELAELKRLKEKYEN